MTVIRRFHFILLGGVMLTLTLLSVEALGQNWTIGTDAKTRWFYGQYTQLGANGFFGPYNIDLSATQDFAPLNGWMGVQNIDNPNILVSGANSSVSDLALELNPKAILNWATVNGRYRMIPYNTATAPGSEVPISPGQWTHWNVGVTMPIGGSIFVGKQYFQRACGLQFGWNRTQEYILFESYPQTMPDLLTMCLPFLGMRPKIKPIGSKVVRVCRKPKYCPPKKKDTDPPPPPVLPAPPDCDGQQYFPINPEDENEVAAVEAGIASGDYVTVDLCEECPEGTYPVKIEGEVGAQDKSSTILKTSIYKIRVPLLNYDQEYHDWANWKVGFGIMPWEHDMLTYDPNFANVLFPLSWNNYDVNSARVVNLLTYLQWYNDVVEFEVGTLFGSTHLGPELAPSTAIRIAFPPIDRFTNEGWLYLKYCNGRFMFRTEFDWFTRETRYQRSLNGTFFGLQPNAANPPGSGSLFAPDFTESWRFIAEGAVQLGPVVLSLFYSHMPGPDRRHGIYIKKQPFIRQLQLTGLDPFYHVSSLMAYRYGSGVNSFGDLADASAIAGRIDYSVAANLNVNASFLRATRVSHGYGQGFIRPSLDAAQFGRVEYLDSNFKVQNALGGVAPFNTPIPAIPSRDIGWELDLGMQWQLLDQFGVTFTLSYWQPGKWFNYACVDKSVPNWNVPSAANNWGVNPNRTIDPVLGVELVLLSSF